MELAARTEEREVGAAWTRKVKLRAPFPWQADVLNASERFKMCFVGRRAGKSELALIAVLCGHGPGRVFRGALHGGAVWWVLPTFPLALDAWDRLLAATRDCWVRKNEVDRRVIMPGGGLVAVRSSDNPDGLRGVGLNGVVIDELKDHGPKVWSESLRPTLADRKGWMLGLGTPGAIGGWSHELFERAKRTEGWKTWQRPSSSNPCLDPEELADARKSLGSVVFAREFEAQFVSASGNMFKRQWLKFFDVGLSGYTLDASVIPSDGLRTFAVCDLAATVKTRSDNSVIGVFGLDQENRLLVLEVVRGKLEAPDLVSALKSVQTRWKMGSIFIESGPYNNLFSSLLRGEGLPIRKVTADRDKIARAEPAVAWLEQGRIWFPRQAAWLDEFVSELCDFPDGVHDDCVDVLAYAVRVSMSAAPASAPKFFRPRHRSDDAGSRVGWLIGRD
jgi:predicted phage terminase large subunit-like protein